MVSMFFFSILRANKNEYFQAKAAQVTSLTELWPTEM
jgi:hypothetical protein